MNQALKGKATTKKSKVKVWLKKTVIKYLVVLLIVSGLSVSESQFTGHKAFAAPINLALNKTATSDLPLFNPSYTPDKAVDDDDATFWGGGGGMLGWLAVDLGTSTTFNRWVVYKGNFGPYSKTYKLQTSTDGTVYTDIADSMASVVNDTTSETNLTLTSSVTARYVRVNITATNGTAPIIKEFKLFNDGLTDFATTSKTGTTADFTWTVAIGATNVKIQQSPTGTNTWVDSTTVVILASTATAQVTGLSPATGYDFKLVVTGGTYPGDSNTVSNVVTDAIPIVDFANASKTVTTASFTWTAASGATSVKIQQSPTGAGTWADSTTAAITATAVTALVTGLSAATGYDFRLVVSGGVNAGYSNPLSASTLNETVTPSDSTPSPTTTATLAPLKEIITADIKDSDAKAGKILSKAIIERTTKADGTKHDEVNFNADQAKTTIDSIKAAGSNLASILIPDAKDEVSELNVTVPKESNKLFTDAKIGLGITTENVKVIIPNESLQGFTEDLYFHFIPIKDEAAKQIVENRANKEAVVKTVVGDKEVSLVGRPMTIETNMQNRSVTLVMPLKDAKLSEDEINNLGIYIEHSDETKELMRGILVPFNSKGDRGLQFTITKFSTFTVVQLPAAEQHIAYMKGYEDGMFKPEHNITRAEMATILSRVVSSNVQLEDRIYSDVSSTYWAKEAISKVTKLGLMKGYANGTFGPNKSITRAEMATLVSLIVENKQQAGVGVGFSDTSDHWAQASILKAQGAGVITGDDDGTFKPNNSLTRAEAVTIMNKVLERGPLNGMATSPWKDVASTHWALLDIEEATVDHAFQIQANGKERWIPSP